MAQFRSRKRKQIDVNNNEKSNESPPHKKQRRGVSVFQRQLYKRKVWVKDYEAGKDQKRRDKRKVMRGYYRALRDLDREHQAIFGHSVSERTRVRAKKKGNFHEIMKTDPNDLRFQRRDDWNELSKPSYQQQFKQSNWSFIDDKRKKNNRYSRYNNKSNDDGDKYNKNSNKNRNKKGNNRTMIGGKLLNSYQKASIERKKVLNEKQQKQRERELREKQRQKAIAKYEKERERRNKIFKMKTKHGQPNLNAQMLVLLDSIKNNQKVAEERKRLNEEKKHQVEEQKDDNTKRPQLIFDDEDDSDLDVNNFLDE